MPTKFSARERLLWFRPWVALRIRGKGAASAPPLNYRVYFYGVQNLGVQTLTSKPCAHSFSCAFQGRIRQPRSWRGVAAAIHVADEPPDGSRRGSDGLDRATDLSIS